MKQEIYIGEKFKFLEVVEHLENGEYLCRCDCGNEIKVRGKKLLTFSKTSCGCMWRGRPKTGKRRIKSDTRPILTLGAMDETTRLILSTKWS